MTSFMEREIASQPALWEQASADFRQLREHLPKPGERVAYAGCGTSWHISTASALRLEADGYCEADSFPASEFQLKRHYDRVVAITRTGTTTEVIDLLKALKGRVPTTVITAEGDSPAVEVADHAVTLPWANEKSVVATRFATTTFALARLLVGDDLDLVVKQARTLADTSIDDLLNFEQFTFLGVGWAVGLANEAALKARETAQIWSESYPGMDYRHGPMSIAQPARLVWSLGPAPSGIESEVLERGGSFFSTGSDPLAELLLVQRVAEKIARVRGLDPDQPRGLARSIILSP